MNGKNDVFRTFCIIYRESPRRFLLCVFLLIAVSTFSPLYLYSADRLISHLQSGSFEKPMIYMDVALFAFAILLTNSKGMVNLLGSYLWITAEIALQKALIKKAAFQPLICYDTPRLYERIERAMGSYGNAVGTVMMLISAVLFLHVLRS